MDRVKENNRPKKTTRFGMCIVWAPFYTPHPQPAPLSVCDTFFRIAYKGSN